MKKIALSLVAASLLVLSAHASQVKESEEHYVRLLRDRTGLITQLNTLALEKSSSASIKTLVARMTDEYAKAGKTVVEIATQLEIGGVGGNMGAPPNAAGMAAGSAAPAGAPPAGAAAGGMVAVAPTGAGASPAGAAAGQTNRGSGPQARNQVVLDSLKGLSGEAFESAYLLNLLAVHEDIERNVLAEIIDTKANAKLAEWSRDFIVSYARNAAVIQQMLQGRSDGSPVAIKTDKNDPNQKGLTTDQAQPGLLFGVTIGTPVK